ncbi:gamma-aminobutyric acid receptor alpha-like [Eurytemora carolleeae]|uniref:gamma-aminobutyric acid receptor alpha-like n=1 Tax=Eurytemora carolleeae TaxID=1294199 RepID=UPI000C780CE1|nr:gamma-aminobutyric acid receptor alpha-like [Eurytemora carolleeae]|eukprot:XP_023328188.1 gamma-aminobutyric acid receptor alpha-like [Eurytemora affinis]
MFKIFCSVIFICILVIPYRLQTVTGNQSSLRFQQSMGRHRSSKNLENTEEDDESLVDKQLDLEQNGGGFERRRRDLEQDSIREELSRNVTAILEDLLKNYDKTERPSQNNRQPTPVRVNILIRSMGPISEAEMYYSMDCYFRQYWRDERLGFRGLKHNANQLQIDQLSLNVKMLEKIWKPDTYFHNGLDSYLHTITRPNKLLRISEHGDITYSMRLTIKAKCPMLLRNFPMDHQSCPLVLGSFAYTADEVEYKWKSGDPVGYEGELQLSQFDITKTLFRSLNYTRSESIGTYSVLQVVFLLQRHTGYFLIQVYVPCTLIVILSWVGFWLNREATSDRVTLGITAVLTLSAIALDSRTDLPKVHYATALDWFIICSFGYCMATLLEFAGVHYFTKVGSGEAMFADDDDEVVVEEELVDDEDWEDGEDWDQVPHHSQRWASNPGGTSSSSNCITTYNSLYGLNGSTSESTASLANQFGNYRKTVHSGNCQMSEYRKQNGSRGHENSVCREHSIIEDGGSRESIKSTVKAVQTQTEKSISLLRQFMFCLAANIEYRREREKSAGSRAAGTINSVSKIDNIARILFPMTFVLYNVIYWTHYFKATEQFNWGDHAVRGNIREP